MREIQLIFCKLQDISQLPTGVEAIQIDYDDQAGLTKVLTGVDIVLYVYVTYMPESNS
jgi:hypothetical protein